jgi:hypothetical protein
LNCFAQDFVIDIENCIIWKIGTREVISLPWLPDHVVLKYLELVCGKNLEKFGDRMLYAGLMGNSGGSCTHNTSRNADTKDCAHGVSDGNKDSTGN